MKHAKILDGVVDAIALEQPMSAVSHTFTIEVPVKGIVENGATKITETVTQESTVTIQVPEDGWIEVPDEVFGGFTVNKDGTFSPPPPPPAPVAADFTLTPPQFDVLLHLLGTTHDLVCAAIDRVFTDPVFNAFAKAKVHKATSYDRSDEFFSVLEPILNITDEQIDDAWMQAKDFR